MKQNRQNQEEVQPYNKIYSSVTLKNNLKKRAPGEADKDVCACELRSVIT